jgi:hypothetical protein
MGMVTWGFLDLHPSSYSGWTSARRAVLVEREREALEEFDVSGPAATGGALAPTVAPKPDPDSTPPCWAGAVEDRAVG